MKVLTLGLDNSIMEDKSGLAQRVWDYAGLVDKYVVMVPSVSDGRVEVAANAQVFSVGGRTKATRLWRLYNLADEMLGREKFDVISVQDTYYLALAALLLARKHKAGLEIQVHGLEKFYGVRKLLARFVLRRADAVRVVSARLQRQVKEDFGVAEERITKVATYTEVNSQQSTVNSGENKNKFVFLTVGRLVPVKNIGLQIEAMAAIVKKYPSAELWIVGEGPARKNYESRIKNYGLDASVRLLGQKSKKELRELYEMADAFVLTSDSEGWGLAVIEAAAHGLPIIMTDVGCAGEVIKNNESGLVVPVGDRSALVNALGTIFSDPAKRQAFGAAARRAVESLPSKEEILKCYLASWQKAAARK